MKYQKFLSWIVNLVFFLAGTLIILVLAYRFGWIFLKGPIYWGNDFPSALSFIFYLDRWWPHLPLWDYERTGGMSFSQSYPILATYLTFFIHKIFGIGIVQVARFLFWISIPLSGIGIIIFTRLIFKNWLTAILAGVFYLLSPDSWIWMMQGGFYAINTSFPLMVGTFILFELASQYPKRILWILTVVFFGLTWLAHPQMATTLTVGLIIYGLMQGLEKRQLLRGISRPILISVAGALLVAFWLIPFYLFRAGESVAPHQINFVTIKEFLGLAKARDDVYITSTFFNGSLIFLTVIGIFFAFVKRSYVYWKLIACAFFGLFLLFAPGIFPWLLTKFLMPFWMSVTGRVVALPRLFLPMIAAFGVVSLGQSLFWLITSFKRDLENSMIWQIARRTIGGIITIIVVWFVFTYIVIIPPGFQNRFFYLGYGPAYGWPPVHQVGNQWMIAESDVPIFPSVSESLKRLLTFNVKVDNVAIGENAYLSELIKKLDLKPTERVDIYSGSIIGLWNTVSGVSQVTNYIQSSLVQNWLGYEQGCFYNGISCLKEEVQNLAKWWGIKFVYLGPYSLENSGIAGVEDKLFANLKLADFEQKVIELENNSKALLYEVKDPTGLATISNKPLVLAIGGNPPGDGGMITLFRSLNRINFSYDRMILIQGKRFVDDYTLAQLKNYPLIILYGYQTHNNNKAWKMLSEYVKEGGSLFVDTGWQYFSQDWGRIIQDKSVEINLPEPLPVSKSKWDNIGTKWSEPSQSNWGDLAFEGKPWGMAIAETQNLRKFGKALVTVSGKVIVASGEIGKGKVVWSGMNVFAHTNYYQSETENRFFLDLFSWLTQGVKNDEQELSFVRINPDLIDIKIDQTMEGEKKIMFKEVMAPGWKAYLNSSGIKKELPIQKAGIGWKLVILPNDFSTGSLILNYQRTLSGWIAILVSIITGLGLILYGLKGNTMEGIWNRLMETLKAKNLLKKGWKEDEDNV